MSDFDRSLILNAMSSAEPNEPVLAGAPRIYENADTNQGSYGNSQVVFQLPMLSSNEGHNSLSNSWIEIPYVIEVALDDKNEFLADPNFLALKGGFSNLVDGHQLTIGVTPIVNIIQGTNIYNNWRRLTEKSTQYLTNEADMDGYRKDNAFSVDFEVGYGETNNKIVPADKPAGIGPIGFDYYAPNGGFGDNDGLRKKMQSICRPIRCDSTGGIAAQSATNSMFKFIHPQAIIDKRMSVVCQYFDGSSVDGAAAGTTAIKKLVYNFYAQIQLKDIDPIFAEDKIQLLHGLDVKLTLQIHTATAVLKFIPNVAETALVFDAANSSVNARHGQVPYIIAPYGQGWGLAKTKAADATKYKAVTITVTSGIAKVNGIQNVYGQTACLFRSTFVSLTPRQLLEYNKMAVKTVAFNELYVTKHPFSLLGNGGKFSTNVNFLVHANIPKPRFLLMHTRIVGAGQFAADTLLSPFSSSPATCAPFCQFRNLQVQIGGKNLYEVTNKDYSYEMFLDQIAKVGSSNEFGEWSGLISKSEWETGAYGFYFFDLSRTADMSADQSNRGIEVKFQYASHKDIQITYILGHERLISFTTDSGVTLML